jgi:DNA-binding MarR family transcriptional regulator
LGSLKGDEFQAAFWSAKRAMAAAAEQAFRRHGVRAGQQFILLCLWDKEGLSPGEISSRLGLATPTVTKAAHRMEAAGLLTRRPDPGDARLVQLHLSRRGKALRRAIQAEMHELTERALGSLHPKERRELIRLLDAVRDNLGSARQNDD